MSPIAAARRSAPDQNLVSRRWRVHGIVQGVGFRPWICLNAGKLGLSGEIGNDSSGVWIEATGERSDLAAFLEMLRHPPHPARVDRVVEETATLACPPGFLIAASRVDGPGGSALVPDLAPCPDCRLELLDPSDRRFHYPFLACTHCGPRYTVTDALPYDRIRTALDEFPLCPQCEAEYSDPKDRRFHAEATACPDCGPRLLALDPNGHHLADREDALELAAAALTDGKIVAVQANGGFQLWVDATRSSAVARLRERKQRESKPLAVMVRDLTIAGNLANLSAMERDLLASPAAPIVLVPCELDSPLAPEIAPGLRRIGLCLPASPLQVLLCEAFRRPVVATSGNTSDEPLCYDPSDAIARLGDIADILLVHDRKILQPADDSVMHIAAGQPRFFRRARGFAPAPQRLPKSVPCPGIAMGGHVKGALALVRDDQLVISPHLGDQDTLLARGRHASTATALQRLLRLEPEWVACDSHPDYSASVRARGMPLPRLEVQHHHAHLLAVLAEQAALPRGPVLGVIWDGSGYGPDGTIWGGEFLLADGPACRRVGRLRRFALPGGESAVREPRRSAFAWLWETLGPDAAREVAECFNLPATILGQLCDGAAGTVRTSSAGRLFDAVAALAGLCAVSHYEGEAAVLLENAAASHLGVAEPYPFDVHPLAEADLADVALTGDCGGWSLDRPELPDVGAWEIDTAPLAQAVRDAARAGTSAEEIAARFHQTLIAMIAEVARRIGVSTVVLGGGCFQNPILLEGAQALLARRGHRVWLPEQFPANDGGLAAGQAFVGAWLKPTI